MAITISGENNNDRITAQDGVIDTISGFNISGIITASSFTGDLTGDVTGNVTGNINNSTLLLQTGSTERVRITSDGKISTGALASPDGNLHVYSSSAGSVTAASDANELVLESSANVGMSFLTASNSLSRIKFGDSRQSNRGVIAYNHGLDCIVFHTVGSEKFRIDSAGDVFIGRTSGLSDAKLSIQCDSGEAGIAVQLNTGSGTSNLLQAYSSAGPNVASITVNPDATPDLMFNVWDGSSTAEKLRITSGGKVGIGTNNPLSELTLGASANPTLEFKDYTNNARSLITGSAGGQLVFQTDVDSVNDNSDFIFRADSVSNEIVRFKDSGEVGIGTNNPGKLLEIFGTDPTIKLRDSSGDAYVLIEGDSADQGSLRFRADPLSAGANTHIRFDVDGTEALRILSGIIQISQSAPQVQFIDSDGTNQLTQIIQSGSAFYVDLRNNTNSGELIIRGKGGGTATERLRISSTGEVKVNGDGSGGGYLRVVKDRDTAYSSSGGNNQDLIIQQFSDATNTGGYSSLALQCNYTGQTGAWVAINAVRTAVGEADLTINPRNNSTGDIERLRITSNGFVGIGTADPQNLLHIEHSLPAIRLTDSANSQYAFIDGNSGNLTLHSDKGGTGGSSYIKFAVDNNAKMHMDAGGRTLFRTNGSQTSPITDDNVPVQIAESTGNMCYFGANLGNSYGALFGYHAAYGGTVIRNVSTSSIVFYTNSTTERLRIDHSANTVTVKNSEFQVNNQELQVTSSNSYACHFNYQDNGSNYISFAQSGATTFRNNVGAGQVMVVYGSGNIGAPTGNNIYNASDERLKENMVELTDGLDKIQKLKPYSFTWKKGFDKDLEGVTQYGFGAHQAKSVDEKLVEKFSENDIELDGETIKDPLRVNEKHVIPLLVKAIQEQQEQIEILKSEVNALKGS